MNITWHTRTALIAAATVVALQVVIGLAAYWLLPTWTERGQFGDVFGAANALFSGLAFVGLIYTILLQREELQLQRRELELTRQELQRTAKAQEQSEVALKAQADAAARTANLATVNALLEHYRTELKSMANTIVPHNAERRALIQELQRRELAMIEILDTLYREMTGEDNGSN